MPRGELQALGEGVHDHCVTNDIDTLATALYVRTDDLLKQYPDLAPWRPAIGLQPRLSDAELVTLAVMQALLGYTSEARWIRHARAHLGHLFLYLPGQPGYNRRLRAAAGLITVLIRLLPADTSLWTDDVWVVDSTPVECGRSRDTAKPSDLARWAEYGYCASHSRWFWGLRLHLVATLGGLPIAFALTGAKADERQTAVRRQVARWDAVNPWRKIIDGVFAACADPAGVTELRHGALERAALLLAGWRNTQARLAGTEQRMVTVP